MDENMKNNEANIDENASSVGTTETEANVTSSVSTAETEANVTPAVNTTVTDGNNAQPPKKEKKSKNKWLILLLLLISIGSVSVAVWAITRKQKPETPKPTESPILTPDYAPGELEKNAESMGDQGDSKLKQPKGGGAVSITYSKDVTIDLSDKKATLMFGNPSRSNQSMVLQIVIQDTIVVQSNTLKPGYQVKKLDLPSNTKLKKPGIYKGKFNVLYYNGDNGKKAVVNTEIPIDIKVQE